LSRNKNRNIEKGRKKEKKFKVEKTEWKDKYFDLELKL